MRWHLWMLAQCLAYGKLSMLVQSEPVSMYWPLVPLKYLLPGILVKNINEANQMTLFFFFLWTLLFVEASFSSSICSGITPKYHVKVPASYPFWPCPLPGKRLWFHPWKNFTHSPGDHWSLSGSNVTLETVPRRVCFQAFRQASVDLALIHFSTGRKDCPLLPPPDWWRFVHGAWRGELMYSWLHLKASGWESRLSFSSDHLAFAQKF